LLARSGNQTGGELLDLEESTTAANVQWKAVNCLYTGWETLLKSAKGNLSSSELARWREQWQQPAGESVAPQTWPAAALTDVGEYLQSVQEKQRLGPRVVLRLSGKGEVRCSPIHVKDTNLVLYVEPPQDEADRLVLVPKGGADQDAFLEVEGGSCDLIGVAIS